MTGLGPVPIKGIAEPVEVYELTGTGPARYRLQATAVRGLSRFVGREAEVDRLREAFMRSCAGEGRLVALVGEPGVGKSRVIGEFVEGPWVEGALVLEGRPVAYRKTPSWLPVVDALRRYCQIDRLDEERIIREKITGKLLALDRALAPALPALLALADLEPEDEAWHALDPPQRRRRIEEAVRNVLLAESRRQPVVFVVEDLQRIDEETQALLDNLVDRLQGARLLILVAYRPEYQHRWGSKPGYAQIRIDPFPPVTARALLDEASFFPEIEYTFKHALTQEVAYGSLLHETRRTLHARIVDAIERLYAGRQGEHVERLAHHALRGGLRARAVDYLRQAGAKAAARSAHREAVGFFEQALEILEADGPRGPALDRGIAFSREMDLTAWLPMLLCARGAAHVRSGRVGDGLLLLEEGVHRASALRILSRHALRLAWLAEGYLLAGHGDRAADAADQAHRLAAEHAEQGYAAMAVRMLGETAARAGQGTRAAEHYADALARARALEMRPLEALCHLGLGELARGAGDGTAAKERLTEAVGLLREMDMRYWLHQAEAALRDV